MSFRRPEEMALAYEALRAAATSRPLAAGPAGLALVLAGGLPGWIKAWQPLEPVSAGPVRAGTPPHIPSGLGGDMVQLLTEMALACTRRLAPL
jgi:hypothetical protein